MFNFPAPKLLQLTAAAAIILTACGGDDTSTISSRPSNIKNNSAASSKKDNVSSSITASKITLQTGGSGEDFFNALNAIKTTIGDATLQFFTGPEIKTFTSGVVKNSDNEEVLRVLDPQRGARSLLINSRTSDGNIGGFNNIIGLEGTNPDLAKFSNLNSLLGNRAGVLCTADASQFPQKSLSQYVYLSEDFNETDNLPELLGKKYRTFSNCSHSQLRNFSKGLTNVENPEPDGYGINWEPFKEKGEESIDGLSIEHAKAYKAQIDGKSVYAIVRSTTSKSDPEKFNTYLSIGLE